MENGFAPRQYRRRGSGGRSSWRRGAGVEASSSGVLVVRCEWNLTRTSAMKTHSDLSDGCIL
jgi:hypothetical protein